MNPNPKEGRLMSEYDPLLTMSALNMAIVSLHRITSSGDRLILDREYDSVINNLRMGEINPDKELTSLYQKILRVIQSGRLRDDRRKKIEREYTSQKHKNIWEIIKGNILTNIRVNPLIWVEKLAVSSASEYFTQQRRNNEISRQNEDEQSRLKHEELDSYGDVQCELLESSWHLLSQYELPDNYRLTQKALDKFSAAMNESDSSKRQRMLKYLEADFAMYAPYWFHLAEASIESGDERKADEYFARFMEVWRPVLRRDPYMAEAMKHKIKRLMSEGASYKNIAEILKCLEEMRANTEIEDWPNNIFAGAVYFSLGYKDEAEECVMCNIDFDIETEMSHKFLERIRTAPLPPRIEPAMSDDDFLKLCKTADPVKIKEAINNGANVNAIDKDKHGTTPLMRAAKNSHSETAELLITHGADINAKDNEGWTALMKAAWRGHAEMTELLIAHGADIDSKDNEGWTALMKAAWKGHAEAAKILLKHNADINAKDNAGWTALMGASKEGRSEIVEALIQHGADVNIANNNGSTALIEAAGGGRTKVAEILLTHGADIDAQDEFGRTALIMAERNHHHEVAQLIRSYAEK